MKPWMMLMLASAAASCGTEHGTCDGVVGAGESCDDGNDDRAADDHSGRGGDDGDDGGDDDRSGSNSGPG